MNQPRMGLGNNTILAAFRKNDEDLIERSHERFIPFGSRPQVLSVLVRLLGLCESRTISVKCDKRSVEIMTNSLSILFIVGCSPRESQEIIPSPTAQMRFISGMVVQFIKLLVERCAPESFQLIEVLR